MVLECNHLIVINAYILPDEARWEQFVDTDPFQKFCETVHMLCSMDKPLYILGDLNACTASLSPSQHIRITADDVVNTRGHLFLDLCHDLTLEILNGNITYGGSGDFTSIQPMGNSIIDYIITNLYGGKTGIMLSSNVSSP
ncbi:hypothetical protein L208DRAFT_1282980 [Tricholoma matsutake]|nr:hypothetical protein L208DRAFT_1282980 [Tricholoma matsutake 945]